MKRSIELPFINVRDVVLFPKMTQGLYIGRNQSIDAIQYALKNSQKRILVLAQKKTEINDPKGLRDMYSFGTVCSVEGSVLLQDRTMNARLMGEQLFKVDRIFEKNGVRFALGSYVKEKSEGKALNDNEKIDLLELLVRAKPLAAFDDEADWFAKLRDVKRTDQLSEIIQIHLNYKATSRPVVKQHGLKSPLSKEKIRSINSKVRLQQQILEALTTEKKLSLLREYLRVEVRKAAESL